MKKGWLLNLITPLISIGCALILWSIMAFIIDSEYILPSITQTLGALWNLLKYPPFYLAFFSTLLRSVIAFIISYVIATVLAYLSAKIDRARRLIKPIISIIRALPTIAVVLLLLFWTNSNVAPVIVTILVVLPTLYTNLTASFCGIDKEQLQMCALFNVPKKKVVKMVVLPQIAPDMWQACGAGLSLNLKLMVAAEVLSQTANSMGYLLNTSKVYFEIANMLALVLVSVLAGLIIEGVFSLLSKKAGKWK